MGVTINLEFDNQTKSYFPGQNVTGNVIVLADKEKKIQGIKIKFEGKARVYWQEEERESTGTGENKEERSTTTTYSDYDDLFEYKFYALGDDREEINLPGGRSSFPFQFTLPPSLPSSYVGTYGSVQYFVQVTIKRSWKFDYESKSHFTVNAILDLNNDQMAIQAGELKKHKNLCCLCCKSGPVGFLLKIPKKGFVCGEFIPVQAELSNMSNKDISGISLSLVQTVTFYAQMKTKVITKKIFEVKRGGIEAGEDSEIWEGNLIQIPSVCPTKLGNCRIIDVQYHLELEMVVSGLSRNLKGNLPLVIGTIPLRNTFQNFMPNATQNLSQLQQPWPSAPPPSIFDYPDLPPPSYFESVINDKPAFIPPLPVQPPIPPQQQQPPQNYNNENLQNQNEFVPKYINYGWIGPRT